MGEKKKGKKTIDTDKTGSFAKQECKRKNESCACGLDEVLTLSKRALADEETCFQFFHPATTPWPRQFVPTQHSCLATGPLSIN